MNTYANYTAHAVNIISGNDTLFYPEVRKHVISNVKYKPVLVIPSDGHVGQLNAQFKKVTVFIDGLITVVTNKVVSVDPLPEGKPTDFLIVSQMYAQACRQVGMDTSRLLCVDEPVYASTDGIRPVGMLQLQAA